MNDRVQLEDIVVLPGPGGGEPVHLALSPDGRWLTFLHSEQGTLVRQLVGLDLGTGERRVVARPPGGGVAEAELSHAEQLRRERLRERGLGITRYAWSGEGDLLLLPIASDLYVQPGVDGELRHLVDGDPHPVLDPQLSADGRWVAYVQDAELYVRSVEGGPARQLTHGARGTGRSHGLAEYIAQEEMARPHGFWWSPDGSRIAYTEVDETHIPVWRIVHEGREVPSWEDHRYPFAGAANADVQLFVVPVGGGEPVAVDLTVGGTLQVEYLARVCWLGDGTLMAAVQDRDQRRLDLLVVDLDTGVSRILLTEQSDVWVNLDGLFTPLETSKGAFLWGSERTGFRHLYRVTSAGEITALTRGEWMVDAVAAVDEAAGVCWLFGTRDGPTERHLYRVSLQGLGDEAVRVSADPGTHSGLVDVRTRRFVDVHSALDRAPEIVVRNLDTGAVQHVVHRAVDPRVDGLGLVPPELVQITPRDGGPTLHGAFYRPEGSGPWPLVVYVYGGPHAQRVTHSWALTADLRAQHLRQRGVCVLRLDNRGSARRGLAFEGAIQHNLGDLEVQDQVDGVHWLVDRGWADPDRVGIYGWSYGGYMSAIALMRAPQTFRVAVAGAPVTHWDGYDTHYTERYMGTPVGNPEGYARSAVMAHVEQLQGALLLVHGGIDENVHFRHTARLVQALVRAGKTYELLYFPDERHMPRRLEDRLYLERRVIGFLMAELRDASSA